MTEDRRDPARPDRRIMMRAGGRRRSDPSAEWMSITRFAEKYAVHRKTVLKWLHADILLTYRVGSVLRVRDLPPDLQAELRKLDHPGNPV